MSRCSWTIWTALGTAGATVAAVLYYRAGGETTWWFVVAIAFVVIWAPTQVWIRRRTRAAALRARARQNDSGAG